MDRLSGLDASFLYLETSRVHMHVGFAAVLDPADMEGGYSFQRVMDHIASRVTRHPAFRRRLVRVPFDLHHPVWVDDPNFDVIHHIRQVALPKPGGAKEFGEMVGRISSTPLDRSRALWEAWVIEGLRGGRIGLMVKFHHCAVDGVSGAGLLMHLFDNTPQTRPVPDEPPSPSLDRVPDEAELVASAIRSRLRQPAQGARILARTLSNYGALVRKQLRPEQPVGGRPLQAPRTHFNASISARRNLATARIPLSDIKRIKDALGVTVNDVILATAGGALRRYLNKRSELPRASLTAVCPISVRLPAEMAEQNNKVSAMWTTLATDVADPVERAYTIHKVTRAAKEEHSAMGADTLQHWAELAAPRTFNLAVRFYTRMHLADLHPPIHNLVISNVPGPRFPLYLAGAKIESIHPMGPVMEGAGLNLTVMSYQDSVDFGFFVDPALVPDVWDVAAATEAAFKDLQRAAAKLRPKKTKKAAAKPRAKAASTTKKRRKSTTRKSATGKSATRTSATAKSSPKSGARKSAPRKTKTAAKKTKSKAKRASTKRASSKPVSAAKQTAKQNGSKARPAKKRPKKSRPAARPRA